MDAAAICEYLMMAPLCLSTSLQMTLTATVSFMVVLTTCSTKECILQEAEKLRDRAAFLTKTDIKQLQIKCLEDSCHQSNDESRKLEKTDESSVHQESELKILTERCGSVICNQTSKCVDNDQGKICVEASSGLTPNSTVPPTHVTTQESDPQASRTDAREDLTPSKTVPPAPVTQDSEPHATPPRATINDLFSAIWRSDLQRVKRILTAGHVNINCRRVWNTTPVMQAARFAHTDMVKFLVGKGADVSLVNRDRNNALHMACMGGRMETVKLILSLDLLDINAKNNYGRTAAYYAKCHRHLRILDLLMSRGAYQSQ